jgi:CHAD domain-containing protein
MASLGRPRRWPIFLLPAPASRPVRRSPPAPVPRPEAPATPAVAAESEEALRRREGVRRGIIRLFARLTRHALRHIEHPASADRTEDIHQVRVQCKRLRALLRLLRPVANSRLIIRENARLRDTAQALSAFRDAFVAGETLKRVFEDTAPRRVREAFLILGVDGRAPKGAAKLETAFENAAVALRRTLAVVRELSLKARGWHALEPGLERSYRRARTDFHECREHEHQFSDVFHEWRKRVKDLAYQLEFLDNVDPLVLKRLRKEFRRLGTLLGDDHDYVVFARHVRQREQQYQHLATFQPVRKRLRSRLKELRGREFAIAMPLFADKPEIWVARLSGQWQRWKNPSLAPAPGVPAAGDPPGAAVNRKAPDMSAAVASPAVALIAKPSAKARARR